MKNLFEEAETLRNEAKSLINRANSLEIGAVKKILTDFGFNETKVIHKEIGKEGIIKVEKDGDLLRLNFYPFKKNGELSSKRISEFSNFFIFPSEEKIRKYLENFERV